MTFAYLLAALISASTFTVPSSELSEKSALHFRDGRPNHGVLRVASSNVSDQIQTKVVVLKRTRRGDEMEVRYRIEFSRVPRNNKYKMYLLSGYMHSNGLPEVDLSKTFGIGTPSDEGKLSMEFGFILDRGEWTRIKLRSLDGTIEKTVRFTLFK
ncbi:hypothetical protein [Boseongicola aestuarii]|uniref:Uncharacterized protein n=1 Tax=Boseongicola aestuarii TaxID=1470561 RepID=A0A238J1G1_9RHOB|nr:hypothetical protein [Boseongicola aestuarii]SMX24496.1 hypothetical protein BOA8489_02622 [Boseongicola aestuarii]